MGVTKYKNTNVIRMDFEGDFITDKIFLDKILFINTGSGDRCVLTNTANDLIWEWTTYDGVGREFHPKKLCEGVKLSVLETDTDGAEILLYGNIL